MKQFLFAVAMIVLSIPAFAQNNVSETSPSVGWDAFKASIAYPEIARRAGVQGNVDVAVSFDSTGTVTDIKTVGYGIFEQPIRDAVKQAKWMQPNAQKGKPFETAFFTVEFKLKQGIQPARRVLRIEAGNPAVRSNK